MTAIEKKRLANGDIAIKMPLRWQKKGGRKMVLVPPGAHPLEACADPRTPDQQRQHYYPLIKALVRAHHWKQQMDNGQYGSLTELARANRLHTRYVWQILQLNFLAPALKAAILDGTQPRHLTLSDFQQGVPPLWQDQQEKWGVALVLPPI